MNISVIDFIDSLSNINDSLQQISKNGISIIDTFAPITTSINIMTTIFATAFGGWITIILFQRQEKMRIKQELRLEFFKEYKNIYVQAINNIKDFQNVTGTLNFYKQSDYLITIDEKDRSIQYGNKIELVEETIAASIKACNSMVELYEYLQLNKLYLKNYKDKLYLTESFILIKAKMKSLELKDTYTEIKKYNLQSQGYDNKIKNLIIIYNQILLEIIEKERELMKIVNDVESIHLAIEKEFIGQYFE